MRPLDIWKRTEKEFGKNRPFFLLDFDGTLAPIVRSPALARLTEKQRAALKKLSKKFPTAVISGRSLKDIKKRVGIKGVYYSGNHGFEVSGPSVKKTFFRTKQAAKNISLIGRDLKVGTKSITGIIIENKGITLSFHYRMACPAACRKARAVFFDVVRPWIKKKVVRVSSGKKVFEVRPNIDWNKGRAVLWLLDVLGKKRKFRRVFPVYIGDDTTDEDAFKALKGRGAAIFVGKGKTSADFSLSCVGDVYEFLALAVKYG